MPPFLFPFLALIAGILASPYLDPSAVWLVLLPAAMLAAVRPRLTLICVFLIGAGLASRAERPPPDILDDGYPRRIVARLEGAPEARVPGYYMTVHIVSVDGRPWSGRARLSLFPAEDELDRMFRGLELGTGDQIQALVRLRRPSVYRNADGFDYRRFLARRSIYWTGAIRSPRLIRVVERGNHWKDRFRNWATERIAFYFDDGDTVEALVLGMTLGQRRRLPGADVRKFQASGLIHLLVVSGFNLAVVAAAALWIGRRLPLGRRRRTGGRLFALILVLTYAVLVEGEAPVARATLMASLLILGTILDRGYSTTNAVAATAFAILLVDPLSLEDTGFQLTFTAVLAIVFVGAPLIRWGLGGISASLNRPEDASLDGRLPADVADRRVAVRLWCELRGWPIWTVSLPWKGLLILAQTAIVTTSVQLVLAYFMVESYHRLSPVALPLNVLGALVAAAITPLGLLLLVLPRFLGGAVAWLMTLLLEVLMMAVDIGLAIPGATLRVPSPPIGIWFLYGCGVGVSAWAVGSRSARGLALGGVTCLGLLALIALGDMEPAPPSYPVLTFIDVGQGDSTLVEMPDGYRIVVDGGGIVRGPYRSLQEEGTFSIGEDVVSSYLFSRGIRHLDALALTHAHNDHMEGLFDLLANFDVGEVWLGPNPPVPRYLQLLDEIRRRGIPIRDVHAGDRVGPFVVQHPRADYSPGTTVSNDDSLVLLLDQFGSRALLTGDLERDLPGLDMVDVLKVPHHGSGNTRLRTNGRIRVISVGGNNRFGHPHPSKLPALRTDVLGAIRIELHPTGPTVSFPGLD